MQRLSPCRKLDLTGVLWITGEVHRDYCARTARGDRTAGSVDDGIVTAGACDPDSEDVVELHARGVGRLEGLGVVQRGRGVDEDHVAAHAVALEGSDTGRDPEGG